MADKVSGQIKEMMYIIGASVITLGIIIYLFYLVRLLSNKADEAFGRPPQSTIGSLRFDFDRYNQVMAKINPKKN